LDQKIEINFLDGSGPLGDSSSVQKVAGIENELGEGAGEQPKVCFGDGGGLRVGGE